MKLTPNDVKEALKVPSVFVQLPPETQNIILAAKILGGEQTEEEPKKKKGCKCKRGKKGLSIVFYKQLYKQHREIFDNYYAQRNL